MDKTLKIALLSLTFNVVFAIYYLVLAAVICSWWLFILGIYYLVLSVVRFFVLRSKAEKYRIAKFTGWMLIMLSIALIGIVILSVVRDRGHELHMFVMIAMAAYAFTKVTLAIINLVKVRSSKPATLIALRNVSLADALVSIFALQRSMLVSFGGMAEEKIVIMNAIIGFVVCVIVFLLGINLVKNKDNLF